MRWILSQTNPEIVFRLEKALEIPQRFAHLLVLRGINDPETAARFLHPEMRHLHDPFLMAGMAEAVERLLGAARRKEPILIYGDYDVDGTMGIVVLRESLERVGASPDFYIPKRLVEGYGMRSEVVEEAGRRGVKLIISVDTGIRAAPIVARAHELGIDCIVTDHHLPEERLPPARAVLNPNRPDCPYPDKNLCAVGVVFKLVQALFERARLEGREKLLHSFLKLVALGTIADVVPLVGENRIFAKVGLEGLRWPANPGLKALLGVAGVDLNKLTSYDVSFRIGPRINAAGRMADASKVIELFTTKVPERAGEIAEELNRLNAERQQAEERILEEILDRVAGNPSLAEEHVLVFAGENWHRGVVGIVASRIVERFHRPALVFSVEGDPLRRAHGSGRSLPAFDLLACLDSAADLFERYGGHRLAAGCSLEEAKLPELRQRLNDFARVRIRAADLEPTLSIDEEIQLSEITTEWLEAISLLQPFGNGNPAPRFVARGLRVTSAARLLKEKHAAIQVSDGEREMEAVGWNMASRLVTLERGCSLDLAFEVEKTDFGRLGPFRLIIRDLHC